jgi:hypothetical protein
MVDWRTTVLLALTLALSLVVAAPAGAHGGEGEGLSGPVAAWMVVLIYIQLLTIPPIGIWLTGEMLAAWRRSPDGSQHEEAE